MENEIMQRLVAVLSALNSITVSGKANLGNLAGSIAMIEEIANMLSSVDITSNEPNRPEELENGDVS